MGGPRGGPDSVPAPAPLCPALGGGLALQPLGVGVDVVEPVHLGLGQRPHELLEPLEVQLAVVVDVAAKCRQDSLVRRVQLGQGTL